MAQVNLSRVPKDLINSGEKFFPKHAQEGEKSPISQLKDYDYKDAEASFLRYQALHKEAEALDSLAKSKRELRDKEFEAFYIPMLAAKRIILALNEKNPSAAEEWGFTTVKNPMSAEDKASSAALKAAASAQKAMAKAQKAETRAKKSAEIAARKNPNANGGGTSS